MALCSVRLTVKCWGRLRYSGLFKSISRCMEEPLYSANQLNLFHKKKKFYLKIMTEMTSHLEGCNWQGMFFRKPHLWGCDRQIMEAKCMINSSHTREVFRWMRGEILCRGMQTAEKHNNCPHPRKPPFLKSFFLTKGTVISGAVFIQDRCLPAPV